MIDARDKVIAEQARELARWKHSAEPPGQRRLSKFKKGPALLGTPLDTERS